MIAIRAAASETDFDRLHLLVADMSRWDAAMSAERGFPPEAVHAAYYPETAEQLHSRMTSPGHAMLVAFAGAALVGCLGFDRFDAATAEVQKFFVRPEARGRGVGRALVDALLHRMGAEQYTAACLETATFMADAIALYEKAGFRRCAPFRAPPPALDGLSVFMQRALP